MRTFKAPGRNYHPRKLTADEERRLRAKLIEQLHALGGYSHDHLKAKTTRDLKFLWRRFVPNRGVNPLRGAEISRHAIKLTG